MSSTNKKNTESFGKIALLMGGWSAEREISLKSGKAVYEALLRGGLDVHAIDVQKDILSVLNEGTFSCAFNILHGRGGENGVIQSILEVLDIPYTGSGVLGSALSMDKMRTKLLWQGLGLPTPEFIAVYSEADCAVAVEKMGLPLAVKPVLEGSSIGMSKVEKATDMEAAWHKARKYGLVIVEHWVIGTEYTASVLHDRVLPLIRLETPRAFYDYEAKYLDHQTKYHCPCGLKKSLEKQLGVLAKQAFEAVGAQGWGRIDLMLDEKGKPWLIEANTVPGMTDHSLVPMAAKQAGIGFDELCLQILATVNEVKHGA